MALAMPLQLQVLAIAWPWQHRVSFTFLAASSIRINHHGSRLMCAPCSTNAPDLFRMHACDADGGESHSTSKVLQVSTKYAGRCDDIELVPGEENQYIASGSSSSTNSHDLQTL